MKRLLLLAAWVWNIVPAHAQFAPQAGIAGSDAVPASSPLIVAWATDCTVARGYMDIANPALGLATVGQPSDAIGIKNGTVVSLGDSGVAVLTFAGNLYNGPGPDFCVFENGFLNPAVPEEAFLELAFVAVSSDGVNFFRFPATSYVQDTAQNGGSGLMTYTNARQLNNLAGKHIAGFGTPFDLQDLAGTPGLDIMSVSHIAIIDAIGDITAHAQPDAEGHTINDPYPTAFPSGGFDLDAVGAMHLQSAGIRTPAHQDAQIYPNPSQGTLYWTGANAHPSARYEISNAVGQVLLHGAITSTGVDLKSLASGSYFIRIKTSDASCVYSFVRL